jgi:hypothetical protein
MNVLNIHANCTKDTFVDVDMDITIHEYSTVYEVLAKVVESMKNNPTAVDPGKYQIRISANFINKML